MYTCVRVSCTWVEQGLLESLFELLALDVSALGEVTVHLIPIDHDATIFLPALQSVRALLRTLYCGQLSHLGHTYIIFTHTKGHLFNFNY